MVEQLKRLRMHALLVQQHSEIVQQREARWPLPQRVAIHARGIVKHPRLVQRQRVINQCADISYSQRISPVSGLDGSAPNRRGIRPAR